MIHDVPVNKLSPMPELEDWIAEIERLGSDEALQDPHIQAELEAHLNDARTWLRWELHRRVMQDGEELMAVLREVGAATREPGTPPPEPPPDGPAGS